MPSTSGTTSRTGVASAREDSYARANGAGASIWEIRPGGDYWRHFHHASDELLIVLQGDRRLGRRPSRSRSSTRSRLSFAGTGALTCRSPVSSCSRTGSAVRTIEDGPAGRLRGRGRRGAEPAERAEGRATQPPPFVRWAVARRRGACAARCGVSAHAARTLLTTYAGVVESQRSELKSDLEAAFSK